LRVLRRIDRFVGCSELRQRLASFYSVTGRPSIDPALVIRMLLIGYCLGIRSEQRQCEDLLHHLFEAVVQRCLNDGLVGGDGFAVDASLIQADANKQRSLPGAECVVQDHTAAAPRALILAPRETG
jgi:transposase